MRTLILFILLFCFSVTVNAQEQLKDLSKEEAAKALTILRKQRKLYLYCGCCEGEKARKIRAEKFEVINSSSNDKFNIEVTYYSARTGTPAKETLDLAYTWGKRRGAYFTIASKAELPHNACKAMKRKWETD